MVSVLAAAAVVGAACGGGSTPGSCQLPSGNGCIDYSNQNAANVKAGCQQAGYTYSESACPTNNRVGTCSVTSEGISQVIRIYTSSGLSAQQAAYACTQGNLSGGTPGQWTTG